MDEELKTLISMLDTALTSNEQSVKKALKNLLVISTLYQDDNKEDGPLTTLIKESESLRSTVKDLRYYMQVHDTRITQIETHLRSSSPRTFYVDNHLNNINCSSISFKDWANGTR